MKKKWLIFGAGGIGRGLLAQIAQDSGYEVIFVAKDEIQAQFLNNLPRYSVKLLENNAAKKIGINHFKAINSNNKSEVTEVITDKDLEIITTSVRPENLKEVAKVLARGLKRRKMAKIENPLIILTCENIIGGAKNLKNMIGEKNISKMVKIPEVLVDCIIPRQPSDSKTINREKYGELLIQRIDTKTNKIISKIKNAKLVDNLPKYQIRKIWGVNGLHLAIAILGIKYKKKYVHQSIINKEVKRILPKLIREMTEAIYQATKFSRRETKSYLSQIIKRFSNPKLLDENERIIRNLEKKLGPEERLLKPARLIFNKKIVPETLILIIARGIKLVMQMKKLNNPKRVVKTICQLSKNEKGLEKTIIENVK